MENFKFRLKGKTLVIIDWANVYGWSKKLKWEVDEKKLFNYLKSYPEIKEIRFYFGVEKNNIKSEKFQKNIKKIGYTLVSKEVKWVPVSLEKSYFQKILNKLFSFTSILKKSNLEITSFIKNLTKDPIFRRKCDFDCEISIDIMKNLKKYESFILISGDGDYAALIKEIINNKKQAIIVALKNNMGKEYSDIKRGLFICNIKKLEKFIKKIPGR